MASSSMDSTTATPTPSPTSEVTAPTLPADIAARDAALSLVVAAIAAALDPVGAPTAQPQSSMSLAAPPADTAARDAALAHVAAAIAAALAPVGAPTTQPQTSMNLAGAPPAALASALAASLAAPNLQPQTSVTQVEMESKSVSATIKYFLSLQVHSLDENLRSLGKNNGATLSFLKMFGFNLGIDFSKKFDISKPIDTTDYFKYAFYCGIAVLLCDIAISKHPSPWAHRLSGVAVLSTIMHVLWIFLSGATSPYHAVFFGLCAVFLVLKRMLTA